jgi:ornithine carbamoyltransferase
MRMSEAANCESFKLPDFRRGWPCRSPGARPLREEASTEVLDGPHSLAFTQAENKLCSAMAALEWRHS